MVCTPLAARSRVSLDPAAVRHVQQVLRLRTGQPLILFDGSGAEFSGIIGHCDRKRVEVQLADSSIPPVESPLDIELWHGLCRSEKMDTVIQKATELGVRRIRPVLMARSTVRLDPDRIERKYEHWRKIIVSACEQSGRTRVPVLCDALDFNAALAQHAPAACGILLHPEATGSLAAQLHGVSQLVLCTGPEGGFSDDETAAAQRAGFTLATLGPRILRTETAPLVALGIAQLLAGDLAAD